jgi:hypothetical protein
LKTQDAIRFFGSVETLKAALKLKARTEIWGEFPPASRQYQLEVLTNGALRAERPLFNEQAERPLFNELAERPLMKEPAHPPSNHAGYTGIEHRVWATRPASNDSQHSAHP